MIQVKILSYKSPQRYAVRRTLRAAARELRATYPGLEVDIVEVIKLEEIEKYTLVLILPSLVIDGKLVCIGSFPHKDEVKDWLQKVVTDTSADEVP
jgi:hypothetical protein